MNIMKGMSDPIIDTIITSPPYWNQRTYSFWPTYDAYMADVAAWIGECYRVLRPGRHMFWIIPDKLPWPPKENGSKERLYMPVYADTENIASNAGFVCEFPVIWDKRGPNLSVQPWSKKMWGSYPYPIGIIHTQFTERICVWRKPGVHGLSQKDREDSKITAEQFNDWARDIWSVSQERGGTHPAAFPIEIPLRILTLWTRKGDDILDPFMGGGTTGIACSQMDRHFTGVEIDKEYFDMAFDNMRAGRP